jgi:hypothetical protein
MGCPHQKKKSPIALSLSLSMVCYWFACSRMQRLLLLVALCLCALVRTDAAPWNSKNDPTPFFGDELGWRSPPYSLPSPSLLHSTHKQTTATHSKEPQRHNEVLHDLPRSGSVSHTHRPWSTYFLQFNKGGIAERFEANYRNFSDTCRESKAAASLQDHLTAIDLEFLDQVDLNNALCPAKHFYYTLHSKEELLRMTISDKLHLLSPAGVYYACVVCVVSMCTLYIYILYMYGGCAYVCAYV